MPWTDPDLEQLFLYGKALAHRSAHGRQRPHAASQQVRPADSPAHRGHLRLRRSLSTATDEPGVALPGEGKGKQAEPMLDKLSALIATMNEKYGATSATPTGSGSTSNGSSSSPTRTCATVALNNDRSQYELVLAERIKEFLVDRHEKNGHLFDLFFANPDFQSMILTTSGHL